MTAMIVGIDSQAGRDEDVDGVGVAPHMLAHPVGDLNSGAGWAAALPARARDAQSVGAGQSESLCRNRGERRRCHGKCPVSLALGIQRP